MPVSLVGRFISGPFNPLYYRLYIKDKGFTVSDACVSCGKCAKRCPLNNIDMAEGRPVWKGNCTHCMACICGCPTEAIEYKSISKGKRRYDIMKE
ncbi:MAG: EFR1 family ferrodoxin [Proteus hauseri]|nr:EFR1 family ferrodoxin [Proteus hauseri]